MCCCSHSNPAFRYTPDNLEVLRSSDGGESYVNVSTVEQAALLIKQKKVCEKLLSQCQPEQEDVFCYSAYTVYHHTFRSSLAGILNASV